MDTKALVDEFQSTWTTMKTALDEGRAEVKTVGARTGENEAKLLKIEERMDELETKLKRPPMGSSFDPESPAGLELKERKSLYFKILRSGNYNSLSDEERTKAREYKFHVGPQEAKALALGDDTTGGFLAPPEYVQDIIRGVQLISPIRQLATVRTTSRRAVNIPIRTGVFAASWIGETATRTETTGLTYSMEEIPTYEMYAEVIVSEQDLEDTVFDLEAEILNNASEQFAKAEGAAFVNGDSIKKPEGFMVNANVASDLSGVAGVIAGAAAGSAGQGDPLVAFAYNLKSAYANDSTWVMNRKTVGIIRRLADSQGRYLWEPGFSQTVVSPGQPSANNGYMAGVGVVNGGAAILGMPYMEVPDMPDQGAANFPIALGNFKRAYIIVDRIDMVIKRLNEKYAEQGQVAYIVRKRVGGQTVLAEALRKYKSNNS